MVGAAAMMLGSSYFEMALGLVRSVLVMNLIGPTGRGIMQFVGLTHRYLTHSHLGALHGISKDLPTSIGREDAEAIDDIEGVGATFVCLTAVLAGSAMFLLGWLGNYGTPTRVSLMAGGGILAIQQVHALYRVVLRAWGQFPILATAGVISTIAQFVFIILGAMWLQVSGAMLGWLLSCVITVLYFRFSSRFMPQLTLRRPVVGHLIRIGLPIAFIIFAETLLRTADGITVSWLSKDPMHTFGLYSAAMQVATYLYRIPEAGGFVIMPRILEGYAAKDDVDGLRRHVMLPTLAAATIMPVAAGCAFILLPPAIRTVIPKWEPCIFAAQILSLGSVLLALPVASNTLLIALGKEFVVAFNKILGAAIIFVLATLQVKQGGEMSTVALAACTGYFVAGLLSLVLALVRYYPSKLQLLKQLVICHLPLAWCVVALKLSGLLTRSAADPMVSDWLHAAVRLALFLVAMIPVLIYGNKRTRLFHELARVAGGALSRFNDRNGRR